MELGADTGGGEAGLHQLTPRRHDRRWGRACVCVCVECEWADLSAGGRERNGGPAVSRSGAAAIPLCVYPYVCTPMGAYVCVHISLPVHPTKGPNVVLLSPERVKKGREGGDLGGSVYVCMYV